MIGTLITAAGAIVSSIHQIEVVISLPDKWKNPATVSMAVRIANPHQKNDHRPVATVSSVSVARIRGTEWQ